MPTYTNSNSTTVFSGDPYIKLEPGITVTDKYIKDLPTGVTLTNHEPTVQPWAILGSVTTVPSASIDVYAWDNLLIYNRSTGPIELSANEDDDNALLVLPHAQMTLDNSNRIFGVLQVLSNEGTGTVYIWGLR